MLVNLLGSRQTVTVVFSYLFGLISKYEFRRQIGDKAEAKRVWSLVENNGYILKNCKLFMYAVHVNRSLGLPTSPARYGIINEDASMLRRFDLSKVPVTYKAYSLFDFDNLEGALISKYMRTYIGKFISRKLIFLVRSYGISREDIEGQMLCSALYAIRKNYPYYESELHAVNTCKTAIHNCGMGLIEYYTRGKRNALLKENGQFQAVRVNIDSLNSVGHGPEHDEEHRVNLKSLVSVSQTMSSADQAFILAASGIYDAGFSLFIGKDNRDVVESMNYDRYLSLLSKYHRLSQAHQNALLVNLRAALL